MRKCIALSVIRLRHIDTMIQEVNAETILDFVAELPGVSSGFPFDEKTLVIKVGTEEKNKIFALFNIDYFEGVNLKCDPERSINLRSEFDGVQPGWHMNKVHWNTVTPGPEMDVSPKLFWDLLQHSYDLVHKSLPRKIQDAIQDS